jgi:Tfp pilus assembly PilM family ATPase
MAKRCIGIDIGQSYLRAVQIVNTAGRFNIEKVFYRQMRRASDTPDNILKMLTSDYGFDRRADIAVAMPQEAVFYKKLETDKQGLVSLQNSEFSLLENNFPIVSDELVIRMYSHVSKEQDRFSVLTAAVSKHSLRERIDALSHGKLKAVLLDSAIFAIHTSISLSHPEVKAGKALIAHIGDSCITLAVTKNNKILIVRNIPIETDSAKQDQTLSQSIAEQLVRQSELTWQNVFEEKMEAGTKFFIVAEENLTESLKVSVEKNLSAKVIIANPYAQLTVPPEYKTDPMFTIAVGLGLRLHLPEQSHGVNFLAGIKDTVAKLDVKKEAVCLVTLVCAIFLVWLISLFVRLSYLEDTYARLKNDINTTFKEALPQENSIVEPLVQLEQRLHTMSSDYSLFGPASAVGPLDVLYVLSSSIEPEWAITIENVLITTESVRITGTSGSFESVYNFQRRLNENSFFSAVEVQDIKTAVKGDLVRFSMLISLVRMEISECI